MKAKLFALVADEGAVTIRHFVGFPPELTDGVDLRQELPRPQVLLIESEADGTFLLLRYNRDKKFCGDTWHPILEEVYAQALFEYGALVSEWKPIPEDVTDPLAYALEELES